MDDLNSRQAEISEKKIQIVINNYFKSECNVDTSIRQAFEKGFRIGVKKGLIAQPEPQWIPCSEGLPKAAVRYQVTFESGEVGYADFRNKIFLSDGSVKENVWETERYYEDDGEVIAWKELPEPYRRKEYEDIS